MSRTAHNRGLRCRIGGGLAATALAAGLALGASGTASADSGFTVHLSPNNTLGLLLDVNGASQSPGAGVIDWYANGGANQQWRFVPFGNNVYELVNVNSGMCLTTDGVAGDGVYQLQCAGGAQQLWSTGITPSAVGAYPIRSTYSGLYLDVSGNTAWPGATIDTWYWNGQGNQYFEAL
ncbi:RICIN domain-containing protein [Streptacidiphilus melanogenes]|uniref:RICIN domain-containing protein n=1 Tax=Streptacidiphilus melanogenes TaxID=411235 RepID=UPI0005A9A534|nr:RICIN domain-containing protein [Streptacidiphilus melanogenes]